MKVGTQTWEFYGVLLSQVENVWAKNSQGSYVLWQWRKMQTLKGNWLVQNWHEEFNTFWPQHSKISKIICTLMGRFWPNYITLQLRKYREVMFNGTQDWQKHLKENWFVVSKMTRIWWILIRAFKSPNNLHFDWSFPVMFDLKNCSYLSWH